MSLKANDASIDMMPLIDISRIFYQSSDTKNDVACKELPPSIMADIGFSLGFQLWEVFIYHRRLLVAFFLHCCFIVCFGLTRQSNNEFIA